MSFAHVDLDLPTVDMPKINEPVAEVTTRYMVTGEPDRSRRQKGPNQKLAKSISVAINGRYPEGCGLYALDE